MQITIGDLFTEYETKRNEYEVRKDRYNRDLMNKYPDIALLENQKRDILIDCNMKIIMNPGRKNAILEQTHLEVDSINKKIEELKKSYRIEAFPENSICPKCHGTGMINEKYCQCIRNQIYDKILGANNLDSTEGSLESFDYSLFDNDENQKDIILRKVNFIKKYVEDYPENPYKQMIFMGQAGLGKSFLLQSFLKELRKKEEDICYISSFTLFEDFHRSRLGEDIPVDMFFNARILAIDDLGSERMTENVTRECIFDLITKRKDKGLYTFFVTNNDSYQLKERYTERVSSRLLSKRDFYQIPFNGVDLRRNK